MAARRATPQPTPTTVVIRPGHPSWDTLADPAEARQAADPIKRDDAGRGWSAGGIAALLLIVLGSAFLQFYRLDDLQHFQGDEGILVLAARALIVNHVFPVYGLSLAVGSAHIGPLFDYMITIPLWLFDLNPTAAVALNGVCQLLAVGLCFGLLVRCGAGQLAGLVAALIYATAQEVVYYSRFLWPNMFPCMVLLMVWSLLALREGRRQHSALLLIWLAVALQLQPTGVLLVPFLVLSLALLRPPLSAPYLCLGAIAFALLFAPSIVHDLTHGLVETKAWLNYSHGGTPHDRVITHTLARLGTLVQRLLGVHQSALALLLGALLGCSVLVRAIVTQPSQRKSATARPSSTTSDLARLLVLLCCCCFAGYLFFGSQLKPHYLMPLFPVPALAFGLLVACRRQRSATGGNALVAAVRGALIVAALALAGGNVAHTWQAGFLLDRYQITLQPEQSNLISLGQMRAVTTYISASAAGARFNLLFAAPDDQPFAYEALLLGSGARFGFHAAPLRFLVVQPPDWKPVHWPLWARTFAACAPPPRRFAAALVWVMRGISACAVSVGTAQPPVATVHFPHAPRGR